MSDKLHPKDRETLESLYVDSPPASCGETAISPFTEGLPHSSAAANAIPSLTVLPGVEELDSLGAQHCEGGVLEARRPHKPESPGSNPGLATSYTRGPRRPRSGVCEAAGGRGGTPAARPSNITDIGRPARGLDDPLPVPLRRALNLAPSPHEQSADILAPLRRIVRLAQSAGLTKASFEIDDVVNALVLIHDLEEGSE